MQRENFLEGALKSDCTPLNDAAYAILKYGTEIKMMRDPTRGGVATTLNEFTESMDFSIEIEEDKIPVDSDVKSACDLLGLDPLYSANEGKILAVVSEDVYKNVIEDLKKIDYCKDAAVIGEITDNKKGKVILKTSFGGSRILDKLSFDMLPRIC